MNEKDSSLKNRKRKIKTNFSLTTSPDSLHKTIVQSKSKNLKNANLVNSTRKRTLFLKRVAVHTFDNFIAELYF